MSKLGRLFRRPVRVGVVMAIALALGIVLTDALGSSAAPRSVAPAPPPSRPAALPPPPAGFAIPTAHQLSDPAGETRWAPVLRATVAHTQPSYSSPAVLTVGTQTPEGTTNLIVATGEVSRGGVEWVHAELATLPNGKQGWLPRSALGGWSFVDDRVVIDRSALTLTLYQGGRAIFKAPVGIGTDQNPTPAGQFYVRDRLTSFASPAYGPVAFGTSARAPYLTDWPDGGYVGIHGTDEPQLIPGHISHGCIRLTNSAVLKLASLMPVGTPVTIQ